MLKFKLTNSLNTNRFKTSGFTMIELLVAMVITAMMLTLVMASYWTFLQTQQRLAISRELQSEVRFTLNRFTDKVRASRIDYTAYEPGNSCALGDPGGDIKLCLIDARGDTFYFENDLTVGNESLVMGNNPANAQFLISPNKFNVNSVSFSFSPALNPRDLAAPQMQPKVTFYLSVSPTNPTYADLVIESQTTISSRQY